MVRWLEANGYDVKYITGVDTDRLAADPNRSLAGAQKPKAFLSVGHDEYWSAGQRASVEAARNAGVSLAFFSGNEVYWKTRWEPSIDGTNTLYRTLVSYKDTLGGTSRSMPRAWPPAPGATRALPAGGRWRPAGKQPDRHDLDGHGDVDDHRAGRDGEPALLAEHPRRRRCRRRDPLRSAQTPSVMSGMKISTTVRAQTA